MMGAVSVIIPTVGRMDYLRVLFGSLRFQSRFPEEVILVFKDRVPSSLLFLESEFYPFPIKYLAAVGGMCTQNNWGIRNAKGDFILILDDDIVLESDFVAVLAGALENADDPLLVGVEGNIVNRSGIQPFGMEALKRWTFLSSKGDGRFKPSGFGTWVEDQERPVDVEHIGGGVSMFRKEIFSRFLFDERLTGYGYLNDSDLSYRISRHFRLRHIPGARCYHMSSSLGKPSGKHFRWMQTQNHMYLFGKNMPDCLVNRVTFILSLWGLLFQSLLFRSWDDVEGWLLGIFCGIRSRLLEPYPQDVGFNDD